MSIIKEINSQTETVSIDAMMVHAMVSRGQQVPLSFILSNRDIQNLKMTQHILFRYKTRFRNCYDIEIENMIRHDLKDSAFIVSLADEGRWKVYSKGIILIMDKDKIYTTYDVDGKDNSNELNESKETLNRIKSKRFDSDKIDILLKGLSVQY